MSKATIINYYPDNNAITAATANANYSALETATLDINATNVRFESIDVRQLQGNPVLEYQGFLSNEYDLGGAGVVPNIPGSEYYSYSDPILGAGTLEQPIQTSSTGVKSALFNVGTKMLVDGAPGHEIFEDDVINFDFEINAWTIGEIIAGALDDITISSMLAPARQELCSRYANMDAANGGSGMGEWFYYIYPKFNIVGNADVDFITVGAATNSTSCDFDPSTGVNVGLTNGANLSVGAGMDHMMVLPIHKINASNIVNIPSFSPYYEGHLNNVYATGTAQQNYDQPPLRLHHTFTIRVGAVAPNTILHATQLYISGIWRLNANGNTLTAFIEDTVCDRVGLAYGVSTRVYLEQTRTGIQIFRSV